MKLPIKCKAQGISVKKKEPAGIHLQQELWQSAKDYKPLVDQQCPEQTHKTESFSFYLAQPTYSQTEEATAPNKTGWRDPTGPSQHLYWKQEGTQCY